MTKVPLKQQLLSPEKHKSAFHCIIENYKLGSVQSTWSTYKSNSDNCHEDCSVECLRALHVLLTATVPHSGRSGGQRGILRRFLVLTYFYNPKNYEFPEEMKITRK